MGKRFPTIFWQILFLVNHSVDNLQYASQNCSHQHSWEQHLQCELYVSTSNLVVAWKPPLELKMVNFRSSKLWIRPNLSITAGCKVYEICWFRNSFQLDSILVTVRPQKREYDRFIRRNEAMPKEFLVHSEGFRCIGHTVWPMQHGTSLFWAWA